jgi:hypothetical protein
VKFAGRAYGLDTLPSEVSVEVGDFKSQRTVYLSRRESKKQALECMDCVKARRSKVFQERQGPRERGDGWIEIEMGHFYYDEGEEEVRMCLKEVKGLHLKGGLIVEGIELRPTKQ